VGDATQEQQQLALLCVRLRENAGLLAGDGPIGDLAASIVRRYRSGARPGELDDALDELEDLLLRAGHAGGLGSYRSVVPSYEGLPGLGDGHPVLEVEGCPRGRCARVEVPGEGAGCAVFGEPLRRIRLRP
jgi:hypothetical protein